LKKILQFIREFMEDMMADVYMDVDPSFGKGDDPDA
jgi:hypothetical protein